MVYGDPVIDFCNFAIKPNSCIYDIGANIGDYSRHFLNMVGAFGKVVAFEPIVGMTLPGWKEPERWELHNIALGNENGIVDFYLDLRGPAWHGVESSLSPLDKFYGVSRVPIRRLDDIRNEYSIRQPDIMKIDVEGHETGVLSGAMATIKQYRPLIIFELHEKCLAPNSCFVLLENYYQFVRLQDRQAVKIPYKNMEGGKSNIVDIACFPIERTE